MSENVISGIDDVIEIKLSEDGLRVDVSANINEDSLKHLYKEKLLTSGCGGGVTGTADSEVSNSFLIKQLFKDKTSNNFMMKLRFFIKRANFITTGCVHKAMIYLLDGTTVTAEDIGRHNAIDKLLENVNFKGLDTTKSILFVSGRLSSEMVTKAVMHRIHYGCFKNCTNTFRCTNST